ncbi:CrcB family protein [archaeon]|nr:MAG: CrcB family protein [archaeon]
MYTQVAGCFIMGLMLPLKPTWFTKPANSFQPMLYVAITSGLCGSITTFSSWMVECNKNFFLQCDLSWGNATGSANGGRLMEWLVSMWIGVALPLAALRLGRDVSTHYLKKKRSDAEPGTDRQPVVFMDTKEIVTVVAFIVALLAVVVVPAAAFDTWVFLTYTAGKRIDYMFYVFACNAVIAYICMCMECVCFLCVCV